MNIEEAQEELVKNKKYVSGCFDDEHCKESFNEGIDVAIKIIEKVESSQKKKSVKKIVSEVNKLRTYTIEEECFEVDLILKSAVLKLLDQLDQPKPVVPKFVADWYEEHKDSLYNEIYKLHHRIMTLEKPYDKMYQWYGNNNDSMETLINMHQFGYTVEKEKLYTVSVLGCTLFKMTSDDLVKYKLIGENETLSEQVLSLYKFEANLTEKEIKQADERLWQLAESAF